MLSVPNLIILVILTSTLGYVTYLRGEAKVAELHKTTLESNIKEQQGVILAQQSEMKDLRTLRKLDSDLTVALSEVNRLLVDSQFQKGQDRKTLGEKDVHVKAFLTTPVPDALRRVLNEQTAKYRGAGKAPGDPSTGVVVARPSVTAIGRSPNHQ